MASGSISIGLEVDLPDEQARDLIRAKFAVEVKKPKAEAKKPGTPLSPEPPTTVTDAH